MIALAKRWLSFDERTFGLLLAVGLLTMAFFRLDKLRRDLGVSPGTDLPLFLVAVALAWWTMLPRGFVWLEPAVLTWRDYAGGRERVVSGRLLAGWVGRLLAVGYVLALLAALAAVPASWTRAGVAVVVGAGLLALGALRRQSGPGETAVVLLVAALAVAVRPGPVLLWLLAAAMAIAAVPLLARSGAPGRPRIAVDAGRLRLVAGWRDRVLRTSGLQFLDLVLLLPAARPLEPRPARWQEWLGGRGWLGGAARTTTARPGTGQVATSPAEPGGSVGEPPDTGPPRPVAPSDSAIAPTDAGQSAARPAPSLSVGAWRRWFGATRQARTAEPPGGPAAARGVGDATAYPVESGSEGLRRGGDGGARSAVPGGPVDSADAAAHPVEPGSTAKRHGGPAGARARAFSLRGATGLRFAWLGVLGRRRHFPTAVLLALTAVAARLAFPGLRDDVVFALLGYLAMVPLAAGLGELWRSPGRRRWVGHSDLALRAGHLVVLTGVAAVWAGITTALGHGWSATVLLTVPLLAACAVRTVTRPPPTYDNLAPVDTPLGTIPVRLILQTVRGPDVGALALAGLTQLPVGAAAGGVALAVAFCVLR